jgi:hypothetical protein
MSNVLDHHKQHEVLALGCLGWVCGSSRGVRTCALSDALTAHLREIGNKERRRRRRTLSRNRSLAKNPKDRGIGLERFADIDAERVLGFIDGLLGRRHTARREA